MAQTDLEKHYDVVVTGTDLTSSLVAAAVSRVGKTVLHLDPFDRYGQEWSAMKLFDILAAPALLSQPMSNQQIDQTPSSTQVLLEPRSIISNVHLSTPVFDSFETCAQFLRDYCRSAPEPDVIQRFQSHFCPLLSHCKLASEAKVILGQMKEELGVLNSLDNNFSLDLTPRFLFSLGEMVTILIRSNVTRYLEFRKIARILTPLTNTPIIPTNPPNSQLNLINVPCTRNDVFKSPNLTIIERRLLMKFLEFNTNYQKSPDAFTELKSASFDQCMADQKLTPKLQHLLVNSVLMVNDSTKISAKAALEQIQRFMSAVGRYADRPYLIPTYGTDDLVQAFCRYSAIYGSTYCLNTLVKSIELSEERKCSSVTIDTRETPIEVDFVVTNYQLTNVTRANETSTEKTVQQSKRISRAIICSRKSISSNEQSEFDNTSVLFLPTSVTGAQRPVYVFETDKSTNACPKGLFIQFFWCDASSNQSSPVDDLKPVVDLVMQNASISSVASDQSTSDIADKTEEAESSNSQDEPTSEASNVAVTLPDQIFSLYFTQSYDVPTYDNGQLPSNLFLVTPPVNELDFDFVVQEARNIFQKMYPEEEFFPKTSEPTGETTNTDDDQEEQDDDQKASNNEKEDDKDSDKTAETDAEKQKENKLNQDETITTDNKEEKMEE